MINAPSVQCGSPYQTIDRAALSSFTTRGCGNSKMFAQWVSSRGPVLGGPYSAIVYSLRNINFSRPPLRILVIESGSFLAIAGGLTSYLSGDSIVGGGGLWVGLAGVITALTPIIQGWLTNMREERKQKLERHSIVNKVQGNQLTIDLMQQELNELHKSLTFKREMIEKQQILIEVLVCRVAKIEEVAGVDREGDSLVNVLFEKSRELIRRESAEHSNGNPPT